MTTHPTPEQSQAHIDGRKSKASWHEEARQMKLAGASMIDIAAKFERTPNRVLMVTRDIKSTNAAWGRTFRGKSNGHKMGNKMRVAVSFTDAQIDAINIIAEERKVSFSKVVSDLVDAVLPKSHPTLNNSRGE